MSRDTSEIVYTQQEGFAASSQLMILSKRLTLFSFEGRIVDTSYNAAFEALANNVLNFEYD